ncbi:vacuolar protein sorting-associated protein VTA1 homolog [Galendromus occidentalis]|uniref:Vacuolar protein sorting-associated protein VTA1 homolog n=1 Tax=Galendromus occidentalis TaxID=34638 RepID=A0AAJ6VZ60_9ACAR|nr:vacuolar protein sorting-associated protein VTA1 homolog [Galendromus occidentalis]
MAAGGSQVPTSLKAIAPYIKIAVMHDAKNPVIAYWCRFYALEKGLKINKSDDDRNYLMSLMDLLEKAKQQNHDDEAYSNDLVAQSQIEAHALKLFNVADQQDKNANFDTSLIRIFHTAGYLFDVLGSFGEISEENLRLSRYAKCKAADIHKCLKEGRQPVPGPMKGDDEGFEEDGLGAGANARAAGPSNFVPTPMPRANVGGGEFDMGLPQVPQAPAAPQDPAPSAHPPPQVPQQPPRDESLGAYPKVPQYSNTASVAPAAPVPVPPPTPAGGLPSISTDQVLKAQKYCKYANSALTYEDINTAVLNLHKALALLTTGVDPQ